MTSPSSTSQRIQSNSTLSCQLLPWLPTTLIDLLANLSTLVASDASLMTTKQPAMFWDSPSRLSSQTPLAAFHSQESSLTPLSALPATALSTTQSATVTQEVRKLFHFEISWSIDSYNFIRPTCCPTRRSITPSWCRQLRQQRRLRGWIPRRLCSRLNILPMDPNIGQLVKRKSIHLKIKFTHNFKLARFSMLINPIILSWQHFNFKLVNSQHFQLSELFQLGNRKQSRNLFSFLNARKIFFVQQIITKVQQ